MNVQASLVSVSLTYWPEYKEECSSLFKKLNLPFSDSETSKSRFKLQIPSDWLLKTTLRTEEKIVNEESCQCELTFIKTQEVFNEKKELLFAIQMHSSKEMQKIKIDCTNRGISLEETSFTSLKDPVKLIEILFSRNRDESHAVQSLVAKYLQNHGFIIRRWSKNHYRGYLPTSWTYVHEQVGNKETTFVVDRITNKKINTIFTTSIQG